MEYTALLSPDELLADALESTGLSYWDSAPEVERAIQDISSGVETYLDRKLIVREHTLRFRAWKERSGYPTGERTAYAPQWPVLQIVDVDGDTSLKDEITIYDEGRVLGFSTSSDLTGTPYAVTVLAGYRRSDQGLADLQDEVDGLTALPPVLPHDIRGVCVELTLHRLFQAENKQFGTGQKMQNVGGVQATVQATDTGFIRRTLSRLARHRSI